MSATINDAVVYCVARIRVDFEDDGRHFPYEGTGFWVRAQGRLVFVTNRHNLDPNLRFGSETERTLSSIEIEMRIWDGENATRETQYHEILSPSLAFDEQADCALVIDPNIEGFHVVALPAEAIADDFWLENRLHLMDRVFFVGYPRSPSGKRQWWDTGWNLPVSREASIASLPSQSFENSLVALTDVTLVSGHSFSGSSGSPVIHPAEGGDGRIVGLMTGHLGDRDQYDIAVHGGLSYYTRSSAIWRLMKR